MKIDTTIQEKINNASKIFIVWASGSGKTTLAKKISQEKKIIHLDLDDYCWEKKYTIKTSLEDKTQKLKTFLENHKNRVIEWVFVDRIDEIYQQTDLVIVLDIPNHKIIRRHLKRFIIRKLKGDNAQTMKEAFLVAQWATWYQRKSSKYSKHRHIDDCKKYWCKYLTLSI